MTKQEAHQKIQDLLAVRGKTSHAPEYILICLEALGLIKFEDDKWDAEGK